MIKLKELEKRLRDEPANLGLRVTLAGAYREAGRLNDAVELYRSVAIAYRDQGRNQQAMLVCKSVLEIAPNDAASKALLAALTPPPPPPVRGVETDVDLDVGTLVAAPVIERPAVPLIVQPSFETAGPKRRSSLDETPLPRPITYHDHDPTTSNLAKLSESDLVTQEGAPIMPPDPDPEPDLDARKTPPRTRSVRPSVAGIASAARRISSALVGAAGDNERTDVAAELDTRERPRLEATEVDRISKPPPTVPFERSDLDEPDDPADDALTPVPGMEHREEDQTQPRDYPGVRSRPPTQSMLTTQFFAPLPADRRSQVLTRFQRRSVTDGAIVIRQGEIAHPLALVSRGRLDVRAERSDGRLVQVGTVAAGEYVGEVALLHRVPAAAHVIAIGDAELLVLPPRDFYELLGAFPALWAELKEVAERRQREYEYRLRATR